MKRGFLLGKFLPLHNGHVYMIDFALAHCDHLTIYIGARSDEPIPAMTRYKWMLQLYGDIADVILVENDDLPQKPEDSPTVEEFRRIWISEVQKTETHPLYHYDYVFASESYGKWLAEGVGAQFIPVDPDRIAIPISGTEVRFNPYDKWEYLPEVVRKHYVKRICLFGPESTGKSTIARYLTSEYQTKCVPEYGRTYTEMFGSDITTDDMENIYRGHIASTKALLPKANKVLICDTDPILSAVWSDLLTGQRAEIFDEYNDPCDYYLLMDVDLPWVDDGTRYFKNREQREDFFQRCQAELDRRNLPYAIVNGSGQYRLANAKRDADRYLQRCGILPT